MKILRIIVVLVSLLLCSQQAFAVAAEGTCICDQYGCSKVINGMWTHVSSCPASSSRQDSFNGPVRAQRDAEHNLATLFNHDLIVDENRLFNFDEWSNGGTWKKSDPLKKRADVWKGPDGMKYDSPEQGWHMRGGRYEPANIKVDIVDSGVRMDLGHDTTTFSGASAGRMSREWSLRGRYLQNWDNWGISVEVPVTQQSNNGTFTNLDNTSLGVTVMPVYHLMRSGVHGMDANIAGLVGYRRHWYKGGSTLAVPGFDNPSYLEAGLLAALRKTTSLGTFNLGISHEQVRDQTGASMAGKKSLGFTTLQGTVQIPLRDVVALGADLGYSSINGLPAGMDTSSLRGGLSLLYRGKRLNYGGGYSSTWGNRDYRTSGFNFWLSSPL